MQPVEIYEQMQKDTNKCLVALAGVNQGLSAMIDAIHLGKSVVELQRATRLFGEALKLLNDGLEEFAEHGKPFLEGSIYE